MHEQRLTNRLLTYWDMVRKDQPFPEIQRFNPSAIEDIWPFCFKVSVDHKSHLNYQYEYMGEPIAKLYGKDLTGTIVDYRMKDFPGSVIHVHLPHILEKQAPLQTDGHFITKQGRLIKYRACMLPFGNAKKGLTHVVVGLSCRYF